VVRKMEHGKCLATKLTGDVFLRLVGVIHNLPPEDHAKVAYHSVDYGYMHCCPSSPGVPNESTEEVSLRLGPSYSTRTSSRKVTLLNSSSPEVKYSIASVRSCSCLM
jgi:hypothetical protein